MNLGGNAAFDLAEVLAEQEREAGIASARAALSISGRAACIGCGRPIPAARRLAHPAATRCLECQQIAEKETNAR